EIGACRACLRRGNDAVRRGRGRQGLREILSLEFARTRSTIERGIDGQAQVGARSFQIVRDGESASDNRVAIEASRCPGKSKAWLEKLAAVDAAVQRTAGATLTGSQQLAANGIEVVLLIVFFDPRCMGFITQAQSQGEVVRNAPGILSVAGDNTGGLLPPPASEAAPEC